MTTQGRDTRRVAVIGGGAGGCLVAVQLLRVAAMAGVPLEVCLVEPRANLGCGIAYSTDRPEHLLNVPAGRMSALPDVPDHFVSWLNSTDSGADAAGFVPRSLYGEYIRSVLREAVDADPTSFRHIHDSATGIEPADDDGFTIRLAGGGQFHATDVVLALGAPAALPASLPESLTGARQFVADPWDDRTLTEATEAARSVLLLGTGLTMVDVALRMRRAGLRTTAISRMGLQPRVHTLAGSPLPPPELPASETLSLEEARAIVDSQFAAAKAAGVPWQSAMDSLRPVTNDMWQRLSAADREEFLTHDMRRWEVLRHRLAPQIATALTEMLDTEDLVVISGDVAEAEVSGDRVVVGLRDGRSYAFDAVVACTGAGLLSRAAGHSGSLLGQMRSAELVRPHSLDLGIDVDDRGRVVGSGATVNRRVWVVGHLRRGRVWETTAMPEIRTQAAEVARDVVTG